MTQIRRYGWVPDLPDQRDFIYAAPTAALQNLPPSVDLRPTCPPEVYDQGQLGSCTGNAIAGSLEFDQIKQKLPKIFTPSRLFIYYNERTLEGTVSLDNGAHIRNGIKSVANQGACPEEMWQYDISKFKDRPGDECYAVAAHDKAISYQRVDRDLDQMKGCLASGYPFVFGFSVYQSFESQEVRQTGHTPMPAKGEKLLGGHAVLAVGYEDANQWFIVRNSWGSGWGMGGYFTIPYAYLLDQNLSDDFWTIRQVEG